jgi:hypothetical protein
MDNVGTVTLSSGAVLEFDKVMSTREKVFAAEAHMKQMPQVDIVPVHYFSKGVYAREITIPEGTVLTGEIHKFTQLNILSKGEISVLTEDGIKRVSAPFTVVSPAGTKRIAYAHSECVWTTVHGTDETDIDTIKSIFIAKDEDEWLEFCGANQLKLGFE